MQGYIQVVHMLVIGSYIIPTGQPGIQVFPVKVLPNMHERQFVCKPPEQVKQLAWQSWQVPTFGFGYLLLGHSVTQELPDNS